MPSRADINFGPLNFNVNVDADANANAGDSSFALLDFVQAS